MANQHTYTSNKLRLLSKIEKTSYCWLWTGHKDKDGYGKDKGRFAHRSVYLEFIGPIPSGLLLCHHCDNPPCVNPSHLFLGSYQDNMNDMIKKNRQYKPLTQNSRLPPNIYRIGRKFVARSRKNGKRVYLGIFGTIEKASFRIKQFKENLCLK